MGLSAHGFEDDSHDIFVNTGTVVDVGMESRVFVGIGVNVDIG
jgi:hypothetical protein